VKRDEERTEIEWYRRLIQKGKERKKERRND
jgi:hypothetical protein